MKGSGRACVARCLAFAAICACGAQPSAGTSPGAVKVAPDVAARRAQFVPHTLGADTKGLSTGDLAAIRHLVRASRLTDAIFQRQACPGYPALAQRVGALAGSNARAAKDYFRIMMGPWDRLRRYEPFLDGAARPLGAAFYPEDLTKEEFERFLASHPGDRKEFTSPVTVIRRRGNDLVAIPYSLEYRDLLEQAAAELKAAAETTPTPSLKRYLNLRAEAFLSNDYAASDLAWLDLDGPIEAVIGPYETYEDGLFGTKATFEAFICVEQPADSQQLAKFKKELPYLESRLPVPDEHKSAKRTRESAIRIASEVIAGGGALRGVQTLAFDLPDDGKAREAKGSRRVLLKNMMQAKYDAVLTAVAARVLPGDDVGNLSFDAYFHHVLFHELSHGLGPQRIKVGGRDPDPRAELKELYRAVDEAKADVLGVYTLAVLGPPRGPVSATVVGPLPWTYLAGLFQAARFGADEPHGLGAVIQINYLVAKGSVEVTPEGRFTPVLAKFAAGIRALAHDLLMIEAEGSYRGAQELVKSYGTVSPAMAKVLESLRGVPVDVEPVFAIESGTS